MISFFFNDGIVFILYYDLSCLSLGFAAAPFHLFTPFFSLVGKRRRQTKDFPGADIIIPQIKAKTARKRVGLVSTGPPVRQHTPILGPDGKVIGQ